MTKIKKHCFRRLLLSWLVISLIMACGSPKREVNKRVIVSVGDGILTVEQLNQAIPTSIRSKVSQEQIGNYIQQWIEMELIYQEALRLGMDKDKALLAELEQAKREILVRNYLDKHLADSVLISETLLREYYNENRDNYICQQEQLRAWHILVANAVDANVAYQRIKDGEDFDRVASEMSIDYKQKGRMDVGYFSREDIVPEVAAAVFNTPVGMITKPIKSEFGYHIFKIIARKPKGVYLEFEEVKDQIMARLKTIKRNEKYIDLIIELRNKTNINRNTELLKEVYKDTTYQKEKQTIKAE